MRRRVLKANDVGCNVLAKYTSRCRLSHVVSECSLKPTWAVYTDNMLFVTSLPAPSLGKVKTYVGVFTPGVAMGVYGVSRYISGTNLFRPSAGSQCHILRSSLVHLIRADDFTSELTDTIKSWLMRLRSSDAE